MNIEGLDDMQNSLNKISSNLESLKGKNTVNLKEIFTDSFMRLYTQSESFQAFLNDLNVYTTSDFEKLPQEELDSKVKAETSFNSFDEMLKKATNQYLKKRIFG